MEIPVYPVLSSDISVKPSYKHVFDAGSDNVMSVLEVCLFSMQ
jgi:hypothetical protein